MAPDRGPTGARASSRGYKARTPTSAAAPLPAPRARLVRGPLRSRNPTETQGSPAPHLHPAPQPPRSAPGDAGPARARGAARDWGEGKPRTCEAGAGAGRAVRGSPREGRRRPGREASRPHPRPRAQSPRASPGLRAESASPPAPAPPSPAAVLTSVEAARIPSGPRRRPRTGGCAAFLFRIHGECPDPEPSRAPRPPSLQPAARGARYRSRPPLPPLREEKRNESVTGRT